MNDFFKSSLTAPNITPSTQIIGNSLNGATGLSAAAKSGLIGAGISAGSGLIGTGLQALMMRRQNKYNIAQWNREVARQDYLLNNQATITKNSLRNAGYSTANPEGMTTQATSSPAGSTPDIPAAPDVLHNLSAIAQLKLIEAQKDKTQVETRKEGTEADILNMDLEKYRQTLPTQVDILKKTLYKLGWESEKVRTEIDLLGEQTNNLNVDTRFKNDTFNQRKREIDLSIEKLENEKDISGFEKTIKEVESKLADCGVLVNNNWLNTLISVAALGKGEMAANAASKFISDLVTTFTANLPTVIGNTIGAFIGAIANAPVSMLNGYLSIVKGLKSQKDN